MTGPCAQTFTGTVEANRWTKFNTTMHHDVTILWNRSDVTPNYLTTIQALLASRSHNRRQNDHAVSGDIWSHNTYWSVHNCLGRFKRTTHFGPFLCRAYISASSLHTSWHIRTYGTGLSPQTVIWNIKVNRWTNLNTKNLCHAFIFTHRVQLMLCWTLDLSVWNNGKLRFHCRSTALDDPTCQEDK